MKTHKKLPQFISIEELAQFGDTHDVTDFADDREEATGLIFELLHTEQPRAVEQRIPPSQQHKTLAEAANLLLIDYQADAELTSFTTLDGEPFHLQ